MIIRLGLLVAASIAALAVKQTKVKSPPPPQPPDSTSQEPKPLLEDGEGQLEEIIEDQQLSDDDVSISNVGDAEQRGNDVNGDEDEEEEKEEVKQISSEIKQPSNNMSRFSLEYAEMLPEFESLLSGEIDLPYSTNRFDMDRKDDDTEKLDREYGHQDHEMEMENNAAIFELERLRSLVRELEEREVKLEGELLEYYGLKEQESDVVELQRQLKIKSVEIDMLNITINSLQSERKKLHDEIAQGAVAKKELEAARNKIKELQRQMQLQANQTKSQLLLLKQQVTGLQSKEEEAAKTDSDIGKKLKAVKELEVEVVELKRKNKELQHEKRELIVKLDSAEAKVKELSSMTESDRVLKVREEVNSLKHANEDLAKQVEGLQMNRFSEVEELVYLRWVNACLRFELKNYQTPAGKMSARDLNKNLSPRSQERAKQLMLEYAGSERGQGDTDAESNFSGPSSPGSEDFDNASMDSSFSKYSSLSKKPSLIQKLKKWGKSKDDSSAMSSPARSFGGGGASPGRPSLSRPKGPLEALMLRNTSDSVAITSYGKVDQDSFESPPTPIRTRAAPLASSDSLNSVASSFQLMSKSVEGAAMDEKYPAYKDRHKLALEREKQIKEKAEIARSERFGEGSTLNPSFNFRPKLDRQNSVPLPPRPTQMKEKPAATGDAVTIDASSTESAPSDIQQAVSRMKPIQIEKRPPRVPRPPPTSAGGGASAAQKVNASSGGGPPPPPPPPPGGAPPPPPPPPGGPPRPPPPPGSLGKGGPGGDKVHRAPELVEFYQSLMKREAKKDTTSSLVSSTSNSNEARSNMIGEIENRSTFLLAVKADVETQGDFVNSLAAEVRAATFTKIEDLLAFVNWLDEELSFLVDERAVLKHFDWPEGKADALREAAFEYQDLMKLEKQVSTFEDDPKLSCDAALKKMYKMLEKVEQSVYALLRTRDMAISRYKEFGIPTDWLQDSGVVGKIKLSSVQLAKKYMKRVATELDALAGPDKEPNREFIVLQGVRFAFRVHQFAGGFDAESMKAFEELRSRVGSSNQGSESSTMEAT